MTLSDLKFALIIYVSFYEKAVISDLNQFGVVYLSNA
jgi:hypothetical protein